MDMIIYYLKIRKIVQNKYFDLFLSKTIIRNNLTEIINKSL